MVISRQLFRDAEGGQTDHQPRHPANKTASYQTTVGKCQDGDLFQHANEFVIVEN